MRVRLALVLCALCALAAAKDAVKLGYIDSNRIFKDYQPAIDAKNKLEEEIARWQTQARQLEQAVDSARAQYDAQKLMLSDEARAVKEEELRALQGKYDAFVQEIWGEGGKLEARRLETTTPLVNKIFAAVQQIASAENYTMIIDLAGGQIAYAAPDLDLTARVLEELNREYKPVAPVIVARPRTAVFPLVEVGADARASSLGEACRQVLYALVSQSQEKGRLEQVPNPEVQTRLSQLSITAGVEARDAQSVTSDLGGALAFYGTVELRGLQVVIKLSLTDVRVNKTFTEEGSAPDQKQIQVALTNLYGKLLSDMGL